MKCLNACFADIHDKMMPMIKLGSAGFSLKFSIVIAIDYSEMLTTY